MILRKICPQCHQEWSVELNEKQIEKLLLGYKPIEVMNSQSEAEFFITGICPTCWDELFKEEE